MDQQYGFVGTAKPFCEIRKTFVVSAIQFVGSAIQFCWIKRKSLCVQPVSVSKSKKEIYIF